MDYSASGCRQRTP